MASVAMDAAKAASDGVLAPKALLRERGVDADEADLGRERGEAGSVIHAGEVWSACRGSACTPFGLALSGDAPHRSRAIRRLGAPFTVVTCSTSPDLTRSRERGTWVLPPREEISSMCYERYPQRRREADESHEMWHDFEHTRPVADPDAPPEVTDPERPDAQKEVAIAER
jgi:hypothetical protein